MSKELGVNYYDLIWTDKLRFESLEKAQELGWQELAAQNGGVVPPMPIFTQDTFGNDHINEAKKDK